MSCLTISTMTHWIYIHTRPWTPWILTRIAPSLLRRATYRRRLTITMESLSLKVISLLCLSPSTLSPAHLWMISGSAVGVLIMIGGRRVIRKLRLLIHNHRIRIPTISLQPSTLPPRDEHMTEVEQGLLHSQESFNDIQDRPS